MEPVPPLPEDAIVDVFDGCNLRCPLCPTGARALDQRPSKMSLKHFVHVLDQLAGVKRIHLFNWGEPLLHPDIVAIVAACSQRGLLTTVHSNLSFRRPEGFFSSLARAGLSTIVASLDGATQQSYAQYRKGGDLALALENLRTLRAAKIDEALDTPEVTWKFIINRHNEHEIEAARALATEFGALFLPVPMGLAADLRDWSPGESVEAREAAWLPKSREHWPEATRNGDHEIGYYEIVDDQGHCRWPREQIIINPRGHVFPCPFVARDGNGFGNVFDSTVMEIWGNEKYARARASVSGRLGAEPPSREPIVCDHCPVMGRDVVALRLKRRRDPR